MEMEMSVVNNYLKIIKHKLKNNGLFYCVNRYENINRLGVKKENSN